MKLYVAIRSQDNPYTRRLVWGRPLGDYASDLAATPPPVDPAPSAYVACISNAMPLVTMDFLRRMVAAMQARDVPSLRLGEGALYRADCEGMTPKYRCGSLEATVVEDETTFALCAEQLRRRLTARAMQGGVILPQPALVCLDHTVRFSATAYIHPFVVLAGRTQVDAGAVVLPFSHLVDTHVGAGAVVGGYHVGSEILARAHVAPYTATSGTGVGEDAVLHPMAVLHDTMVGQSACVRSWCGLADTHVQNRATVPFGTCCRNKEIEPC